MNTSLRQLVAASFVLTLLGQGCPLVEEVTVQPDRVTVAPTNGTPRVVTPPAKTGDSTYAPFTAETYQAARAAGKPIYLFFYANWCPTCKEQEPRNTALLPTVPGDIQGFRVNYNDSDVDATEKALAKEFGVTYQHTAFFLDGKGKTVKKVIGTQSNEALKKDLAAITEQR